MRQFKKLRAGEAGMNPKRTIAVLAASLMASAFAVRAADTPPLEIAKQGYL